MSEGSGEDGDDGRVVAREGPPEERPTEAGDTPFDRFPVDPIGTGIAAVIVLVGVGLLLVGPLSTVLDPGPSPPDAEWTAQRVNETHVQVAHVGGEEVSGSNLQVVVDGTARSVDWPDSVSSGTVVLVRAEPGSTVEVVWTGDGRRRLARFSP